jgi:isochorismate synthase
MRIATPLADPDAALLGALERLGIAAMRVARGTGGPVLASASARTSLGDPLAAAFASRRAGEPWFALQHGDGHRSAVAALGCALELTAAGEDRFARLAGRWSALCAQAQLDPADGPPGCGLAAHGALAFAAHGARTSAWDGFAPASLIVPELSLAARGGECWVTANLLVRPEDDLDALLARCAGRLVALVERPLPLLDPSPSGRYHVASALPASHYEEAVARAVTRIRAGELEKVVLAREVEVKAPAAHDPGAVLGVLRDVFPGCFVFGIGREDATFLGASPELLVRREGARASTVALAGSSRRSADPAVDEHLGERLLRSAKDREENAIVARRIARALAPHSLWVTVAPEPLLVRVANIQHLATPIRAQLARPASVLELAGYLHPTPAVGGEPWAVARELIPALEGLDRGWYAGALGWVDANGDGELCVALRCALLRGSMARCYAGAGIVRDSEPAAELAETEIKLDALLPLLCG